MESAALLAETDQALETVVEQLQGVQHSTGNQSDPDVLQAQVNALLEQINRQLTPHAWGSDSDPDEDAFADDRAQWVQW